MKKREEQIEQDVTIQELDDRLKAVEEGLELFVQCDNCGCLTLKASLFNVGRVFNLGFMFGSWVDVEFCFNCAKDPDAILEATGRRISDPPDPVARYPEAIRKAIKKADTERDKKEKAEKVIKDAE